ncbi:MAG: hypothetical protein JW827_01175 [Spirochaetes bacterium]|nr:hypothetical protein [Spirochaetota bacterium]
MFNILIKVKLWLDYHIKQYVNIPDIRIVETLLLYQIRVKLFILDGIEYISEIIEQRMEKLNVFLNAIVNRFKKFYSTHIESIRDCIKKHNQAIKKQARKPYRSAPVYINSTYSSYYTGQLLWLEEEKLRN